MKTIEKIYDVQTGEETFIEREETSEEKSQRERLEAITAAEIADNLAKETARKAIFEKLGLTEAEAAVLLG